jgi:hypothetical protein
MAAIAEYSNFVKRNKKGIKKESHITFIF